ncbi:MAG TPA: hypothetical protein VKE22_05385 [Haliangiales bacterium]|nr:hypothetical protein [Haliangiales bacterium]
MVGQSTIVASNSGSYAFYKHSDGSKIDAGLGTGYIVPANTLFASFFKVASPNFINKNLPFNQAPSPAFPTYATCDATKDAPSNNNTPAYSSSCILGDYTYDAHSTYDPVRKRFILAAHVRNNNWTYLTNLNNQNNGVPPIYGPPGADPYCWRYLLFAVSVSEDPTQGFWLYQAPEYYADWPRVGVSGNYYAVSNHGIGSEVDSPKPLVTLYLLDDLAQGVGAVGFVAPPNVNPPPVPAGTLRSFPYTQSQLGLPYQVTDFGPGQHTTVGFLVVPTHNQPPDPAGPIPGTAYVMSKSSGEGEVPTLFGFVPNSNPSIAPTVIAAAMPDTGYEPKGVLSYKGQDPTSATIRDGYLYTTYESTDNTHGHLDQQLISTTHTTWSATLSLQPTWGTDVSSPGAGVTTTAPLVEATADGSAVVGYSVTNTNAGTLSARSTTYLANGTALPEQAWASGPFVSKTPIYPREVNRQSIDPLNPQAVWVNGVYGIGGANDAPFSEQVIVNGTVTSYPWCSASWSCYGYSGATTISCGQGLAGLTLTRQESGPCPGACPYDLVPNPTTGQVTNAFVDYYAPVPGTSISYKVIAQDWGGTSAVSPPLTVVATDCSCHPATQCGGGLQCGTISDGCGGTISCGTCPSGESCSSGMCCPTGTTWNDLTNTCTPKAVVCRPGFGDCGGYCCKCIGTTCS